RWRRSSPVARRLRTKTRKATTTTTTSTKAWRTSRASAPWTPPAPPPRRTPPRPRRRFSSFSQHLPPPAHGHPRLLRQTHAQLPHLPHGPGEALVAQRLHVEIGRAVHEIDGVRHPVAHRELDGVHVVAERLAQDACVPLDGRVKLQIERRHRRERSEV